MKCGRQRKRKRKRKRKRRKVRRQLKTKGCFERRFSP
jgi:hypothetical protein